MATSKLKWNVKNLRLPGPSGRSKLALFVMAIALTNTLALSVAMIMRNRAVEAVYLQGAKLDTAWHISQNLSALRAINLTYMTVLTEEERQGLEKQRQELINELDGLLRKARGHFNPDEQTSLDLARRNIDRFIVMSDRTLALSRTGNPDEARAWANGTVKKVYDEARVSLDSLIRNVQESTKTSQSEVTTSFLILIAVLIANGLLLIILHIATALRQENQTVKWTSTVLERERTVFIEGLCELISQKMYEPIAHARERMRYLKSDILKGNMPTANNIMEATSVALAKLNEIDDILSDLLILAGKTQLRMVPIDVGQFLERVRDRLGKYLWNSGTFIITEVAPDTPTLIGDPVLLERAIASAIVEAIECNRVRESLLIQARPGSNGGLELVIEADQAGQKTKPSSMKAASHDSMEYAVSEKIVNLHGGVIKILKDEGRTTVEVKLPVRRLANHASLPATPPSQEGSDMPLGPFGGPRGDEELQEPTLRET